MYSFSFSYSDCKYDANIAGILQQLRLRNISRSVQLDINTINDVKNVWNIIAEESPIQTFKSNCMSSHFPKLLYLLAISEKNSTSITLPILPIFSNLKQVDHILFDVHMINK